MNNITLRKSVRYNPDGNSLYSRSSRFLGVLAIITMFGCIGGLSEVYAATVATCNIADAEFNQSQNELTSIDDFCTDEVQEGSVNDVAEQYRNRGYLGIVQVVDQSNLDVQTVEYIANSLAEYSCEILIDGSINPGLLTIVWNGEFVVICPDEDAPVVVELSTNTLTIIEAGTGTYTIALTGDPDRTVTVTPSSGDADVTVFPESVSFNSDNWDTPQTVTVSAASDDDTIDNRATTLTHLVTGLGEVTNGGTVAVTVIDELSSFVTLSENVLTIEEDGTGTYTIALTGASPQGDATVTPSSNNPDVTFSPPNLSFDPTSWDTPQTVTVSAAPDDDTIDDSATLAHSVTVGGFLIDAGTILVIVNDDDRDVRLSVSMLMVEEDGTGTYTITLTGDPDGTVTVTPSSDNPDVSVSPANLSFDSSNWNTPQTVTVSAAPDDDTIDDSATLAHSVTGLGDVTDGGTVAVTVNEQPQPVDVPEEELAAVTETIATVAATAVSNVTTNIGARFSAARGGTSLSVAGQSIAQSKLLESAPWSSFWNNEGYSRALTSDDLLRSTAFQIALGAAEGAQAQTATQWTVWGRGDLQSFSSNPDRGAGYDGDLRAGYLGFDVQIDERWLAGVAVSQTAATADYTLDGNDVDGQGQMDISLTSLLPYIRFAPNQKSELWAILGSGGGEIENVRPGMASTAQETSDLTLWMAAAGGRQALETNGPLGWALLGDMSFGRVETEDGVQAVSGLTVDTWRARLGVEGSFTTELESGGSLTAFMEVAGRYDGSGEQDEEAGIELSPGLYFSDPGSGFGVEVRGRALVLHSAENYEEYGLSATASLSPRSDGLGPSLSLSPSWGNDTEGAETLWRDDAFGQPSTRSSDRNAMSLDARAGYGIRAMSGILTPFGEFGIRDEDSRQLRIGTRFNRRPADPGALSLELSGEWRERPGRDLEQRVGVTGRIRF